MNEDDNNHGIKKLTIDEQINLELDLIEANCVNQNSIVCKCGHISHFQNNSIIKNSRINIPLCDICCPFLSFNPIISGIFREPGDE